MARREKIPIIRDADGSHAAVDPAAAERPVPPRPPWMPSRQGKVGQPPRSRNKLATPTPVPKAEGDASRAAEHTLSQRLWNRLSSAAAAGYGISLVVHLLFLLGMGFWILPELVKSRGVTTVVQSTDEAPQPLGSLDGVQLELPGGQDNQLLRQFVEATLPQKGPSNSLEHQFLRGVTAAESRGGGAGGASGTGGGFRLLEPGNAVTAGSFTAWTIPIAQRLGEEVKAGDDPRPGQDYHIVIQIKVPGERRVYSISDLSGRVIGTDGYVQVIPAQSYYRDEEGQLIRVRLGNRLPVVDSVVQILVHVPGAEALVKDTIVVKSRRLDEEQTLELVFGRAARNAPSSP